MPVTLSPPRVLAPVGDRCGEGATWNADDNCLYWTDINRYLVHRWRASDQTVRTWMFDEPIVALALTTDPATMIVATGARLLLWRPETDDRKPHGFDLEGWPLVRLNDGRPDPGGRFWIGSMRNNVGPEGQQLEAGGTDGLLFRIEGRSTSIERRGIGISNTLCWSPDRTKFYFADTLANVIWVHDYDDAAGRIGAPRVFFEGFDRGWPDGSAMDAEGHLWNCRFGGGCIVRLAPNGSIERVIDLPVTNVTTCTFGGPDLKTVFITTASVLSPDSERLAGSLFTLESSVAGLAENRFAL
jgi:sugar lactone lactonase YvrE